MGNQSQERMQRERYLRWIGVAVALTGWGLFRCWQRHCERGGGRIVRPFPCPEVPAPPAPAVEVEQEPIEITAFLAPAAPEPEAAAPEPITPARDDLTRIVGIGAKVAAVLSEAGITSFAQLAAATPEQLREVLRGAGLRFMDPTSWPQQAALAAGSL